MQQWRSLARVSHLQRRRLRPAPFTVMRRLLVTVAAALTVTPCTIAHTMVMGTQRTTRGPIIGLMHTPPTTRCIGIIDPLTLTQGTSRGFIGRCMQRTGHIIVPMRTGADVRCFPERCG
jgi:hypothetical protein